MVKGLVVRSVVWVMFAGALLASACVENAQVGMCERVEADLAPLPGLLSISAALDGLAAGVEAGFTPAAPVMTSAASEAR